MNGVKTPLKQETQKSTKLTSESGHEATNSRQVSVDLNHLTGQYVKRNEPNKLETAQSTQHKQEMEVVVMSCKAHLNHLYYSSAEKIMNILQKYVHDRFWMEQTAVAVTATYRPFTHSLLNSE
jgi:hypothetical protein